MLPTSKKLKLTQNLKAFQKKYFGKKGLGDLDESGTRLLVNDILNNVLGFESIEEIKTEYMIRGTYADYMIQTKGTRHFLVEVKALSLDLSDKHLRQAINYGANEGVEWAMLTNGREIELYRILFTKPIESKLVFKVDISDSSKIKETVEHLQYISRDAVIKKSLDFLWNRFSALETYTIAGLLYNNKVINILKRELRAKYKSKFEESEIRNALNGVICQPVNLDKIKITNLKKAKSKVKGIVRPIPVVSVIPPAISEAQNN